MLQSAAKLKFLVLLLVFALVPCGARAQESAAGGSQYGGVTGTTGTSQGGAGITSPRGQATTSQGAQSTQGAAPGAGAPQQPTIQIQPVTAPEIVTPPQGKSTETAGKTGEKAEKEKAEKAEKEKTEKEKTEKKPELPLEFADITERNEFQVFVAQSVGRFLPMFGYSLFAEVPSTFAPVDRIPVTPDYVVGPGDEILIRAWGQIDVDVHAVVDRTGNISIPRVGVINVSGIKYQELQGYLKTAIGRVFRNFELNVSLGQLRSILVFVVGQARRPGTYTVSSLSTLVNTLFASGGPSVKGSMRHIQLKRGNQLVTEFDLYDLLLKGDKSKDVQLLPGDVIYIPPIGQLAAISGSVNVSAIYELKDRVSLEDLINLAGGLTTTAAGQKVTVERIVDRKVRKVDEFSLDKTGLARPLQDGDLISVFSVLPRFDNAITLRGNVAAPARYPWREGMRVTDLLVDKNALITGAYWERQNRGVVYGRYTRREVNWDYATVQRLQESDLTTKLYAFNLGKAIQGDKTENIVLRPGDIVTIYSAEEALPKTENDVTVQGSIIGGAKRFVWREHMRVRDLIPDAKWLVDYYDYWFNLKGTGLKSEINWDYANVVRLQPKDLTKTMIPFNLGKAVLEGDQENNVALRPGDEITVYSKDELQVPVSKQSIYVRLEGEINSAGFYKVQPGETLRQLVARVGGLSPNAYLFGSEFTRESARVLQQKHLDEAIDRLERDIQRNLANAAQGAISTDEAQNVKTQAQGQLALVARLRQIKASGRVVLEISPETQQLKDLPDLALEDGDRFVVPPRPSTVGVVGTVYNENTFIYRPEKRVSDYLAQAGGPTKDADTDNLYVLRADGSVISKRQSGSLFTRFNGERLMPGDTVVVPEQLEKFRLTKELKDWSQIVYQFALGVAGLKVLKSL